MNKVKTEKRMKYEEKEQMMIRKRSNTKKGIIIERINRNDKEL